VKSQKKTLALCGRCNKFETIINSKNQNIERKKYRENEDYGTAACVGTRA
jgi:hypothetical protein